MATGGRIAHRFEDLSPETLGHAGICREINISKTEHHHRSGQGKLVAVEKCSKTSTMTILCRGASEMMLEEAKRSMHDAACVVRNIIRDNNIVYGGGAIEIGCSLHV